MTTKETSWAKSYQAWCDKTSVAVNRFIVHSMLYAFLALVLFWTGFVAGISFVSADQSSGYNQGGDGDYMSEPHWYKNDTQPGVTVFNGHEVDEAQRLLYLENRVITLEREKMELRDKARRPYKSITIEREREF